MKTVHQLTTPTTSSQDSYQLERMREVLSIDCRSLITAYSYLSAIQYLALNFAPPCDGMMFIWCQVLDCT